MRWTSSRASCLGHEWYTAGLDSTSHVQSWFRLVGWLACLMLFCSSATSNRGTASLTPFSYMHRVTPMHRVAPMHCVAPMHRILPMSHRVAHQTKHLSICAFPCQRRGLSFVERCTTCAVYLPHLQQQIPSAIQSIPCVSIRSSQPPASTLPAVPRVPVNPRT